MRNFCRCTAVALIFGMLAVYPPGAQAQRKSKSAAQTLITSIRFDKPNNEFFGTLYATINGAEKKIADAAIDAWIIEKGRNLVYSKRDGAGGFEGEGESLRIFDAQTRKTRKVMSEYYAVSGITEVRTVRGKTALIVKMTDGGLGALYLAVVDPTRGEVFFRRWAKLLSRKGDIITIGYYREEDDWVALYENENAKVRPYKTETFNLSAILKRPVIINRSDRARTRHNNSFNAPPRWRPYHPYFYVLISPHRI